MGGTGETVGGGLMIDDPEAVAYAVFTCRVVGLGKELLQNASSVVFIGSSVNEWPRKRFLQHISHFEIDAVLENKSYVGL